jgi:hypothetical protein
MCLLLYVLPQLAAPVNVHVLLQVNEMHLLMAFNSPYVIRAYRCLTYKRILPPAVTERNDSITVTTRDSMDTSLDGFGGAPLHVSPSLAAATAASNSGGKRGSNSSVERTRSHGGSNSGGSNSGGSNGIVCVVNPKAPHKSGDAAANGKGTADQASVSQAGGQSQGTPSSIVGGLIKVRSSSSLHATPNGGRPSNQSNSLQMTPGGTNVHTSRSSGGQQGSRGSKNVPEGVNMLATWLVQVRGWRHSMSQGADSGNAYVACIASRLSCSAARLSYSAGAQR